MDLVSRTLVKQKRLSQKSGILLDRIDNLMSQDKIQIVTVNSTPARLDFIVHWYYHHVKFSGLMV